MLPDVETAITEIRAAFPDNAIEVHDEPQGGAYVIVQGLDLGAQYEPGTVWVGFLIQFTYPASDVYPHFTDPTLRRVDGQGLGPAFQTVTWRDRPAMQISRRSNGRVAGEETATIKLYKVLEFLRQQ